MADKQLFYDVIISKDELKSYSNRYPTAINGGNVLKIELDSDKPSYLLVYGVEKYPKTGEKAILHCARMKNPLEISGNKNILQMVFKRGVENLPYMVELDKEGSFLDPVSVIFNNDVCRLKENNKLTEISSVQYGDILTINTIFKTLLCVQNPFSRKPFSENLKNDSLVNEVPLFTLASNPVVVGYDQYGIENTLGLNFVSLSYTNPSHLLTSRFIKKTMGYCRENDFNLRPALRPNQENGYIVVRVGQEKTPTRDFLNKAVAEGKAILFSETNNRFYQEEKSAFLLKVEPGNYFEKKFNVNEDGAEVFFNGKDTIPINLSGPFVSKDSTFVPNSREQNIFDTIKGLESLSKEEVNNLSGLWSDSIQPSKYDLAHIPPELKSYCIHGCDGGGAGHAAFKLAGFFNDNPTFAKSLKNLVENGNLKFLMNNNIVDLILQKQLQAGLGPMQAQNAAQASM